MPDRLIPTVEDALCWWEYLVWSRRGETFWCDDPHGYESASVALDAALSVGRRWLAPSWLEEVAW